MYQDDLRYYYQHLYPYQLIYKWLTYNEKEQFAHRQLSFQFGDEGAVQRYVKFPGPKQMKARMTSLGSNVPRKVDAGAIWNCVPDKDNKEGKTVQRQFVFDFDMNDYDDVRTCCTGKTVCTNCWKMIILAQKIITTTLTEDFGFTQYLNVFSGGRGLHIWVCDERARMMSDQVRKSIVDYLQVVTANDKATSLLADNIFKPHYFFKKPRWDRQTAKDQLLKSMHPHITRSLNILSSQMDIIFQIQNSLMKQNCLKVIKNILEARNKTLMERVIERWQKCEQTSKSRWKEMVQQIEHYQKCTTVKQYPLKSHQQINRGYSIITFIEQEIIFSFLYPRMDYQVSNLQNHLLKLPFSIHPSKRTVSVPLFGRQFEDFNPDVKVCLKIDDLIKQLEQLQKEKVGLGNDTIENAMKTRLVEYLVPFQNFIQSL